MTQNDDIRRPSQSPSMSGVGRVGTTGVVLVALAAALWGTDGVFRRSLAFELPAVTVVFWEHAILVLLTIPWLRRAIRASRRFGSTEWLAAFLIGAGASTVATVLFTMAFQLGNPTTPLLLQKLQPLFALVAARLVLGERLRSRFGIFLVGGLVGAWLIAFSEPFNVNASAGQAALLAIGAAALWAMGTVLGRLLTARLAPAELTALRFGIGLPVAALLVLLVGDTAGFAITTAEVGPLILLALVPGLLALSIYYRGLATTPASMATIAELAFPLSAIVLNRMVFGTTLTVTQWAGVGILVGTLVAMSLLERRGGPVEVGVDAPPVALTT